ncbi:MAG: hypothetical protein HWD59_10330 [Coxiellaceae bacterium]|nr:MAG: hypothetical protein HWD59_10330 [Coxiellaceae bacterium]
MPKILQHPSLIKVTLPPSYTNSDELMLGLDDKARAIQATKEAMQLLDDIKRCYKNFPIISNKPPLKSN